MRKIKKDVIVIGGPTASGKTGLSVELAKKINGQIVSADSMQIYKDMNIGTAKVTKDEMQGIKHYMIDIVSPNERYSVAEFKEDAEKAIEKIIEEGCIPIVVGGTGLYINSLIYNINYPEIEFDKDYRNYLEEQVKKSGLQKLYEEAKEIDSKACEKISPNDKKRILRIFEIYKATGNNKTEMEELSRAVPPKYNYRVFAINFDRKKLYDRINLRVDKMLEDGLVEEVKNIKEKYNEFPTAMQGLGYKEVVDYLENKCSYEEMVEKIKQETRRYAKRQITWFRGIKDLIWLNAEDGVNKNINIILEEINWKKK